VSVPKLNDIVVLGKFRPVPYFFFYDLMPLAKGIPPMFWKFTVVLWCDVTAPAPMGEKKFAYPLTCKKSMRKWQTLHRVNKAAAMDFTAAYRYSGMFEIKYGFKHIDDFSGQPTEYIYNPNSTEDDWRAFITGLSVAYRTAKQWNMARRGKLSKEQVAENNESTKRRNLFRETDDQLPVLPADGIDSSLAFQLMVAVEVDHARTNLGLKPVNVAHCKELIEQGAGKVQDNGDILYAHMTTNRTRLG
jgi:hypothetical protein